jgi:hypothetical protein
MFVRVRGRISARGRDLKARLSRYLAYFQGFSAVCGGIHGRCLERVSNALHRELCGSPKFVTAPVIQEFFGLKGIATPAAAMVANRNSDVV